MIIIDGKVKRNLQEQVGYNAEQIAKIFELIDGLNIQDNLVKVDTASGVLTPQEMEVVSRDVAFIVYNDKVYVKSETSASEFIFKQVALTASDQGTYNILQSFRIVVTRASGAYAYSSNTVVSFYNKAEMDTMMAAKANLAGADFSGAVTAPTLKQANANYASASGIWTTDVAHYTIEDIYTRCEEINNVLYAIVNIKLTRIDSGGLYYIGAMYITLPADIANKIYDLKGNLVTTSPVNPVVVTADQAKVFTSIEGGSPSAEDIPCFLNVLNVPGNNRISLYLSGRGYALSGGEVFWITARIPLTLI